MSELGELRGEILDLTERFAAGVANTITQFVPGESAVPVSGKVLDPSDFVALVDASLDGWLTSGRFHKEFEQ